MATVTGLTAQRMIAMENATVVDGDIVGNDLVLKTRDGTTINAGNVRGPQGIQGPPGPAPIVGEIRLSILTAPPDAGWFILNGQTITNAQTLHTQLWAVAPVAWRSGANLVLPNAARRHLIGDAAAPGVLGGSDMINLLIGHMPAHTHGPGTLLAVNEPGHTHSLPELVARKTPGMYLTTVAGGASQNLTVGMATGTAGAHDHNLSGATASAGSGTDYEHRPQYMTVNMMIFAGYS